MELGIELFMSHQHWGLSRPGGSGNFECSVAAQGVRFRIFEAGKLSTRPPRRANAIRARSHMLRLAATILTI
jgi:hypothetical protein